MADIVSASTTKEDDSQLYLPPGFRFHPTDEEIITNYLSEKVADQRFTAVAMGEVDLNSCEPWDLPKKAKMGEKVWYFFCQKDRKYPTGMRTNRATEAGYWKATGKDKEIYKGKGLVGMKKTLVFYKGRAPKGEKTNWVMHEFRLDGDSHYYILPQSTKDEWVVCRVFHKNEGIKKNPTERPEEPAAVSGQQMNISPEFNQILLQNQYFLPQIPPPNPFFARSGADGGLGYLHQGEAMGTASASSSAFIGQCKVEQVSNSMASRSQETGMSSDWHGEISSNNGNDLSSSVGSFLDLENIWDY